MNFDWLQKQPSKIVLHTLCWSPEAINSSPPWRTHGSWLELNLESFRIYNTNTNSKTLMLTVLSHSIWRQIPTVTDISWIPDHSRNLSWYTIRLRFDSTSSDVLLQNSYKCSSIFQKNIILWIKCCCPGDLNKYMTMTNYHHEPPQASTDLTRSVILRWSNKRHRAQEKVRHGHRRLMKLLSIKYLYLLSGKFSSSCQYTHIYVHFKSTLRDHLTKFSDTV